jgi:hypothetical protein
MLMLDDAPAGDSTLTYTYTSTPTPHFLADERADGGSS